MGATETSKALVWRLTEESWNYGQFHFGKDRRMNRVRAVQRALAGRAAPVYLEIGVSHGFAFRRIAADEKTAIDPEFKLSARTRKLASAKARVTHYFETTSDAFFANDAGYLEHNGVDVALVDGLHTYKQVVRDVENILRYLKDDGVIVLHDCNPTHPSIAYPAASYEDFRAENRWWQMLWSGDVWKAIVHLRSTRADLQVAVLNCDFGVGIVRKGSAESQLSYTADQIEALDYVDLVADRERLLNLKPPTYFDDFLASDGISPKI
ncbi:MULTISPECIES: class I SAM-dependent methyltransferase [Mycobacterium]|uniref:Biotin carboxyl carrier protein n=1 Tax=Mycobacterium pseudoshottsii TaxID=265949 RepID=A0A9N7LRF6_9MYCO|nr:MULTISPECIES: class I SAM-dependent methyltransferase [Mycobacterium]EPQ46403.1 Biotin carboxyl carrier protein [Mycobacterium sp. 012931]MBC9861596.1 Biotin carboxyl carrier protein [Mycobacterium pseudoshottsii]RFZ71969.1 hypothetical protein DL240490_00392 [Mycobacterium marinum]BBA89453.1 hypothetical protein MPSD_40810 [Mycobacterium pseudoshottsii JCM 15466]BDN83832.1 hypothetical protein NJB1907Z4_C40470 [Mycobacterium pseudoshottsii]